MAAEETTEPGGDGSAADKDAEAKARKKAAKAEKKTEERAAHDQRQRENQQDIWDIGTDAEVDSRVIITDWASI